MIPRLRATRADAAILRPEDAPPVWVVVWHRRAGPTRTSTVRAITARAAVRAFKGREGWDVTIDRLSRADA